MHHQYQEFKQLSIRVEGELKKVTGGSGDKATQKDLPYLTTECWGAIYRKGDQTVPHTHWGSLWSWCYYLKVPEDAPPFRFANVISKTSMVDNNLESKFLDVYPQEDDLIFFPSWMVHCVPKSNSNQERVMIAGNVDILHPTLSHKIPTFQK